MCMCLYMCVECTAHACVCYMCMCGAFDGDLNFADLKSMLILSNDIRALICQTKMSTNLCSFPSHQT